MKTVKIADRTLCNMSSALSFKEKLEVARQLERLNIDYIEFPEIVDVKADTLLIKTVASFVKHGIISVAAGSSKASVDNAVAALSGIENSRIRIELPVSPVCMEYNYHKKPQKMLEWIADTVCNASKHCKNVEFFAEDATRAEGDFLKTAVDTAVSNGASAVTLSDTAANLMPDRFAEFVNNISDGVNAEIAVCCNDKNGLACASSVMAVKGGADTVKAVALGDILSLDIFAGMLKNCGHDFELSSGIKYTELGSIINKINRIADTTNDKRSILKVATVEENTISLDKNSERSTVASAVQLLGYNLGDEDAAAVYEEFLRVAQKKTVGAKELDAIVATTALQVPATYKLESYVVNNGNKINTTAQVTLIKDGKQLDGICIGDGPIAASFLAIEQILGHHYELDDFQIQSVTEGKEAVGSALVKLRSGSKLYSGNGISTDIIGASIRAYIAAINKIAYEEG